MRVYKIDDKNILIKFDLKELMSLFLTEFLGESLRSLRVR